MRCLIAATALAAFASAKPFQFPLANGFPKLSPKALAKVEKAAGGPLPNGKLPTKLTKTATATVQLVASQEIFEVAYFTTLLENLKAKSPGYELSAEDAKVAEEAFHAIVNQEQLHATGANAILATAGEKTVTPCEYIIPKADYQGAVLLANTFTDVVLGAIPQVQSLFAEDGGQEADLIPLLGSILGQEAEQNGFFRLVNKKKPSAAPFLSSAAGQFAYSALRLFIKPGTCSVTENLPIPYFTPIVAVNPPKLAMDKTVKYEIAGAKIDPKKMVLTYITGQSLPISVPISKVTTSKGVTSFEAELPFASKGFSKGLSIAAVTKKGKFANVGDVAAATYYGPGLIEVR